MNKGHIFTQDAKKVFRMSEFKSHFLASAGATTNKNIVIIFSTALLLQLLCLPTAYGKNLSDATTSISDAQTDAEYNDLICGSKPFTHSFLSSLIGSLNYFVPNSTTPNCPVRPLDLVFFGVLILAALELLNFLVKILGKLGYLSSGIIPVRGKHLDELSIKDYTFISANKIATPIYVYFLLSYMYHEPNMKWDLKLTSFANVLLPVPALFIIYDFFYTILHWFLHIKGIYEYIHKHHHHQKAPSRAQVDAVNVHPIEFFLGEYNHLFTIFLLCNENILGKEMHVLSIVLFHLFGGGLASLNHTRFDFVISFPKFFSSSSSTTPSGDENNRFILYDSKNHDVHHRIPQSNYGQYIMFWDYVFGSYRAYDPNDRVNPKSQLDPNTGKSFSHAMSKSS